jgi:hypothetical protein
VTPTSTSVQPNTGTEGTAPPDASWDLIVVGIVDACLVCQFSASPNVAYSEVLAGVLPPDAGGDRLNVVSLNDVLLAEDGTPSYVSERPEIVFLKRITVPGYEESVVYEVVFVLEATPENIDKYRR